MERWRGLQKRISLIVIVCLTVSIWHISVAWCQSGNESRLKEQIEAYRAQLAADATRVDIRCQLAKVYLKIEDYAQAVAEYQQVITTIDNSTEHTLTLTEASYGLGLAYAALEQFEAAIEAYQRAIQLTPAWAHIHAALGAAYSDLHRYAEALTAYKVARDLQPDDAMIHHQLGNIYSKRGKRAAAIAHQQRAIAIAPTLAAAHYQLGLLYSQENRLPEAISAYQTAYTADSELIEALYNLAQAHLRHGDKQAAREQMQLFEKRKAVVEPVRDLRGALQRTREPIKRARILANIGRLYLKSGAYQKAVWEYEKALALNPEVIEAYNGIGIAWTMLKRYKEAVAAQQRALKLQPDFAEAHAALGLTYLVQEKTALALKHYQQAVTLNPKLLEARLKIGLILLNQKRYVEAASAYQAALRLNPDDAEPYHNLGICYLNQGKPAEALSALKKAVEIDRKGSSRAPFLAETHYLIGELQVQRKNFAAAESAYLTSGLPKAYHSLAQLSATLASTYENPAKRNVKLKAAADYAQTAIRLNPNVASYHNTLALISYRKGEYRIAEAAIRKAIELDPKNPNYKEGLKQITNSH